VTPTVLVPIVVIAVVGAAAIGIYADAQRRDARGTPVVASLGSFVVDTPQAWFVCCLFFSVVFVPLYLSARTP
jgi:chromate transport protein ChrA